MLLFNIMFCILSIVMVYRGFKVFNLSRKQQRPQESAISMAIVLMHFITAVRSLLIIEVGPHRIEEAGLLLNYYLFLGSITIQLMVSDFILKFLTEIVTPKNDK